MPLTYSSWTVGGVNKDTLPDRLRPIRFTAGENRTSELEFVQGGGVALPPLVDLGETVTLSFNGTVYFRGRVETIMPQRGATGWSFTYRALGLEHYANMVPMLNPNIGRRGYRFNMPTEDEEYSPSLTGLTLGDVCKEILGDHETALNAAGIEIDNLTDFDVLDWTPPRTIEISNDKLWNGLQGLLSMWAPNHRLVIEPDGTSSQARLRSITSPLSTVYLTVGDDLVEPPTFTLDIANTFTRVEVLGGAEVEPFYLHLSPYGNYAERLYENWTPGQEAAWTISDFEDYQDSWISCDVSSMTSTSAVLNPDNNSLALSANDLSGQRRGHVRMFRQSDYGVGSTVTTQQTRAIASHTALTAGGTFTVTFDRDVTFNTFTRAEIYALKDPNGLARVHRQYYPADATVRERLQNSFAKNEVFRFGGNTAGLLTKSPMAYTQVGGAQYQGIIEIDTGGGYVTFTEPVVALGNLNSRAELETGGTGLTQPDDVVVFVPVAVRQNRLASPADTGIPSSYPGVGTPQYDGTAYDWFGITRTFYLILPDWKDWGARDQMQALADEYLESMKDVGVSGVITVHGFRAHEFLPVGRAVSIDYQTGPGGTPIDVGYYDDTVLPIRGVAVQWGGPDGMTVSLEVNNSRQPHIGTEYFMSGISGDSIQNIMFANMPMEGGTALGGPGNMPGTFSPVGDLTGMAGGTVATMRGLGAQNNVDTFSRSIGQGAAGYDLGALSRQMGPGTFNAAGAMNERYGTPISQPPQPAPPQGQQPDPMRDILGGQ